MKIIIMVIFLLLPNIILAKQFYSPKSKSTIYLSDKWFETDKISLEEWNRELIKNAPIFKGYSNHYYFDENEDVYIYVQVTKGNFKPEQLIKSFKLTKDKVVQTATKAIDNLDFGIKLKNIKLNTPIWSDELNTLVSKSSVSRSDGVNIKNISYITYWYFLKNHIAVFHCYYPDNMNLDEFYTKIISNIKFDTAHIRSDGWYKSLYALLGLKYLKRIIK